jgi:hypothetical protein
MTQIVSITHLKQFWFMGKTDVSIVTLLCIASYMKFLAQKVSGCYMKLTHHRLHICIITTSMHCLSLVY